MKLLIDKCSKCDCGKKRVIVNKRHYLCDEKNKERLNNQSGDKEEKRKSVLQVSEKQKERLLELKVVYEELRLEREQKCCCCDSKEITHSHIIPRSRRKDLETDKENIVYDCMFHHKIWEHGSYEEKRKHIKNFDERMAYIKRVDIEYYNLLMIKWQVSLT